MSNPCAHRVPRPARRRCRPSLRRAPFAFLTLLTLATSLRAQQTGAPDARSPFRRWDVSAGVGGRFFDGAGLGDSYSNWNGAWQPRVQVGRYLSRHLKVELTAHSPSTHEFFSDVPMPGQGLPFQGYVFAEHRSRVVSAAPAVTYQFLENAFAHPFISAGLDVSVIEARITRMPQTRWTNGLSRTTAAAQDTRHAVRARPLVAAGVKSYFNERVFVRPEGSLAFSRPGVAQFSLRLDLGVDF